MIITVDELLDDTHELVLDNLAILNIPAHIFETPIFEVADKTDNCRSFLCSPG